MAADGNRGEADALFAALAAAHDGLDAERSARLDRRLVVLLASRLGDPAALREVVGVALAGLGPAGRSDAPVVLHDFAFSSASYRVRIALALKGIPFRRVPVDLRAGAHREPAHRALNPQGLVPALEIDGRVLTQSLAIIEYLDATRPGIGLLPEDPAERARLTAIAHAIAMEIAPVCNSSVAAHAASLCGGGEPVRVAWMQHFIARGLAAVERMLDHPATGRFAHGDAPGLVDCCLVPQLYNARRWSVPLDGLSRLVAIDAACTALPAFVAAHPETVG
jgi:maleylacetoacetate isomerase